MMTSRDENKIIKMPAALTWVWLMGRVSNAGWRGAREMGSGHTRVKGLQKAPWEPDICAKKPGCLLLP